MIPVSLLGSPGAIGWDSLPLIKIDCFPFGKGHDHPFSQARILALEERELRVRLWSFEVSGSRESHLTFLLHHGEQALACVLFPGQRPSLWSCGPQGWRPGPAVAWTGLRGEDLQGEFWGGEISLPQELLGRLLPGLALSQGQRFLGGFWKGRGRDPEQFGCSCWEQGIPVEISPFLKGLPDGTAYLEELRLVSY